MEDGTEWLVPGRTLVTSVGGFRIRTEEKRHARPQWRWPRHGSAVGS